MAEEFILTRDIIQDHSERMLNIKKYYPYFKLTESGFSQFAGGRYEGLDMGYILMAVLRFFIEENNFREKDVTYDEYKSFMHEIYRRDFAIALDSEEEAEVSAFIFDKIKNDGKPFSYSYFDPADKKRKTVRMKLIDSRIKEDTICYYITSDAIEFYLDTKEIKDESSISVAQVLLGKMIASSNFRGGIEVIKRINSEVGRLKARKNEVLNILSYDVFEGTKAYEEFVNTGMRWFEDEQKLFIKNMELVKEAASKLEHYKDASGERRDTASEIFYLEAELKKAIIKHSELLAACTDLQIKADEIISSAKFSKLRRNFNFKDALRTMIEKGDATVLENMVVPILSLNAKKQFSFYVIDKLLMAKPPVEDKGEKIEEADAVEYVYEDELEETRISSNYVTIIKVLLDKLNRCQVGEGFNLREFNEHLAGIFDNIYNNGDYYSMLVHMCQKKRYDIDEVAVDTDTFFEAELKEASKGVEGLVFELTFDDEDKVKLMDIFEISNIYFKRV